jgi:hypothetical protein
MLILLLVGFTGKWAIPENLRAITYISGDSVLIAEGLGSAGIAQQSATMSLL